MRRLDKETMKVELESKFADVPKYTMHAWILEKKENNSNTYTIRSRHASTKLFLLVATSTSRVYMDKIPFD